MALGSLPVVPARTPAPVVLTGSHVRLEPLCAEHGPDLFAATGGDEDVWRWLAPTPRTQGDMSALVEAALAAQQSGQRLAYAVVLLGGRAIGSTSFVDIEPADERVEIGWTFYGRAWWAGPVNPDCKLMLLRHCFEDLGMERVAFKTDACNERSQAAIRRLGATYEGTLRHHRVRHDGGRRDTVYFSVLAAEWPAVRAGLVDRLHRYPTKGEVPA